MFNKVSFFTIALFFSTLISHSNIYKFIPLFFFVISIDWSKLKLNNVVMTAISLVFIVISGVKFLLYDILFVDDLKVNSFIPNFIVFLTIPIFIFLVYENLKQWVTIDIVIDSLGVVLKIHLLLFFLQVITYYLTGYFIDYVKPFTGEETRYLNSYAFTSLGSIRFTGAYVEPSTYATFVVIITSTRLMLKKINKSKLDYIDYLASLSTLITFSTASYVYGLGLLSIQILYRLKTSKYKLFFLIFSLISITSLCFYYFDFIYLIFNDFIFKVDTRGGIRTSLIDYILNNRHGFNYIFGESFYGLRHELYTLSNNISGGERVMASVNDSGFGVYLIVLFGVVGLPFLSLFLVYILAIDFILGLIILNVFLTKVSIEHYPIILMFVFLFFYYKKGSCEK